MVREWQNKAQNTADPVLKQQYQARAWQERGMWRKRITDSITSAIVAKGGVLSKSKKLHQIASIDLGTHKVLGEAANQCVVDQFKRTWGANDFQNVENSQNRAQANMKHIVFYQEEVQAFFLKARNIRKLDSTGKSLASLKLISMCAPMLF